MVNSLLLWHVLHCGRKQSSKGERKPGSSRSSRGKRLHPFEVKTEKNDFEYEQSTCRVCLKPGYIPIYGCEDVSDDLRTFTGIEVSPDDKFPKYLCKTCNSSLERAVLFRKTAQESELVLKQATQNVGVMKIENNTSHVECDDSNDNHDDWYETTQSNKISRDSSDDPCDDFNLDYSSDCNEEARRRNRAKILNVKNTTTLEDLLREINGYKEAKVKFEEVRPKTFHCVRCNIGYDTIEEYSDHMSVEHDNLRRTCPICNKSYNLRYLKKHLALHKNEKPYMCDICGKKFAIQGQFSRHRVTHFIEDLPFQCSMCPYRGRFNENLKLHMRTHTNDKRYQCPQCPTRYFINKSNLNRHLLTHKTDHDFKCNQCQRGFYKKRDLELHFKVDHGGIKDHVCDLCGKAFGFRKQMMKHQLKVHKREKMRSGRTPLYVLLDSKKQSDGSGMLETGEQTSNDYDQTDDAVHNGI